MAATLAGRVALGLGVTPKVWPRCTGAVDGFTVEFCAGIAAAKAALGCGARITVCGFGCTAGRFTLASIWIGFGSGFGLGISICRGCSSTLGGSGGGGSSCGGGCLIFTAGGGLLGTTSSVIS